MIFMSAEMTGEKWQVHLESLGSVVVAADIWKKRLHTNLIGGGAMRLDGRF